MCEQRYANVELLKSGRGRGQQRPVEKVPVEEVPVEEVPVEEVPVEEVPVEGAFAFFQLPHGPRVTAGS